MATIFNLDFEKRNAMMPTSTRREFHLATAGPAALRPVRPVWTLAQPVEGPIHFQQTKPLLELQQDFVDLRFGMFNHFNLATFQDREWGDPHDPPTVFAPTALDTDQWACAAKSAEMTSGCLTPKHHARFCLSPTSPPAASIKPTHDRVDVVRSYVDSFRREGLKVAFHF